MSLSNLVEGEKRINFPLFEAYKAIYGNLHIRADFVVPYDDPRWHEDLQGLKLGNLAERIRLNLKKVGHYNMSDVEKLFEMGFKLSFREHKIDSIFTAFQHFKEINGHCRVQRNFVVPTDDQQWPEECKGLLLGETLHGIRNKKLHKAIHDDLIALGYDLEFQHPKFVGPAFERIFDAFVAYKTLYGNLDIPRDFVIPKNSPDFPIKCWGVRLGGALYSVKHKGKFLDHRAEMEELGIVFPGKRHPGYATTYAAFKAYKELHGDLRVPKQFSVPENDPHFPPETWGLKLGNSLQSIRNHGIFADKKEELMELGFVFECRKRKRRSRQAEVVAEIMSKIADGSDEDD